MSKTKPVLATAPAPTQEPLPTQPTDPNGSNNGSNPKPEKVKPKRPLPTPRVSLLGQLDILRGYSHLSGVEGKGVKQNELATVVSKHVNTISFANAFFLDVGLIVKGDGGYAPSPEVVSYTNAFDWNPETAALKLAPVIEGSWFVKELMPKLRMRQSMDESEAITELGTAIGVGKEYAPHVGLLIEYMEVVGLVQRDNGRITLRRHAPTAQSPTPERRSPEPGTSEPESEATPATRSSVSTFFTQQSSVGVVKFNVSVNVDMSEFAGWQPDRIAAFFSGIAQVLAAKGMVEKDASSK